MVDHIPGATLHLLPGDGHVSIGLRLLEIIGDLAISPLAVLCQPLLRGTRSPSFLPPPRGVRRVRVRVRWCDERTSAGGLSRDVRAARFHPGTDAYTHEVIGKALLGISPGEPRW